MKRIELKRRNLSGLYIYDMLPGEIIPQPTCIEDCQPMTRRKYCMKLSRESLIEHCIQLVQTFKVITDFLFQKELIDHNQRTMMYNMVVRNLRYTNFYKQQLAENVDFFCEKVTMLADTCGVVRERKQLQII